MDAKTLVPGVEPPQEDCRCAHVLGAAEAEQELALAAAFVVAFLLE